MKRQEIKLNHIELDVFGNVVTYKIYNKADKQFGKSHRLVFRYANGKNGEARAVDAYLQLMASTTPLEAVNTAIAIRRWIGVEAPDRFQLYDFQEDKIMDEFLKVLKYG